MKKFLVFAVAGLALMACNKQETPAAPELSTPNAVSFGAYLNRGVATRSGAAGLMDVNKLQNTGFGVFAYYTDFNLYDAQSTPNFMYNQKVSGANWEYTPVKYWPNEYGQNAISDDVDKVSFFAYAPYVDVTPATGKVQDATYGITGMNRNSQSGDPILKYIGSFDPTKSVDLLWGVAAEADAQAWPLANSGNQDDLAAGLPWLNVQRPTVDKKLKFTFDHALSQLNVQIDADVDATEESATALAAGTKIYVRSITFSGFSMKGALNLNNTVADKAEWLDYQGINNIDSSEPFVIYDGRKDGREGVAGATASNEKSLGLNEVIISDDGNSKVGVTAAAVNLFQSADAEAPIYVIPVDEAIEITIDYDVETADPTLANLLSDGETYGSKINNKITKKVTFGSATANKFENGKSYVIKLHLGMNSVKFDAAVQPWVDAAAEGEAWLPANL